MKQKLEQELNRLVQEFKKCKSKKRFNTLINSYIIIYNIIELLHLDITIPNELDYEINKIDLNKIYNQQNYLFNINYNNMYEYNLKLSSLYEQLNYLKTYAVYNKKISIDDSIFMVKEFLKYYDSDIESYFNEIIKSNFFITTDINSGVTSRANNHIDSYSFINPNHTIRDYFVILHELIHNYIYYRIKNTSERNFMLLEVNNLQETYPSFIEHVASLYLKENKYLINEVNEYKTGIDITTKYFLQELNDNLINNDMNNYITNESYSYGGVLSYHFYDEYLKDKEKTKNNILRFSMEDQYYDKKYMINNYGLDENKILDSKILTKYMDKHYK